MKRANQSLVLRWEPIRAQHWDEKSSEFSMKGEKFSLRINLSSVLWWDLWLCVAKPRWIFTLLLVFATISRHCPGSRHKTWDQRQESSISVLLSSFFFNYWLTPLQKLRKWDKYILLLYYLSKNDFHTHTLSFLWLLNNNVFSRLRWVAWVCDCRAQG